MNILKNKNKQYLEALKHDKIKTYTIPDELLNDREFIIEAVKINYDVLTYAANSLSDDDEIISEGKNIIHIL